MKKQRRMKAKAQSLKPESIKDALSGMYRLLMGFETPDYSFKNERIPAHLPDHAKRSHNPGTFGFILPNRSNGPPGRSRSPGNRSDLTPDDKPIFYKNFKTLIINKLHYLNMKRILNFNQHFNLNYLPIFNSKVMKKQVLFSIVALFCAVSTFGQALPGSLPRGTTCTDDALHPMSGKAYTYEALSNQAGTFTFWATKDQNFISTAGGVTTTNIGLKLNSPTTTPAGTDLLATSANYATSDASPSVQITWSDQILSGTTTASPTFVAVNADGTCTNNFKVWPILPIKAFTVDIRNMEDVSKAPLAFDATENQCIDMVRGATYNAGAMVYDYGKDTLYFEVIAANFTNSWTPTFTVTGLAPLASPVQTAVVEWTYDNPATTPWGAGTTWHAATDVVSTTETNTTNGVSIYARVIITNNNYEGINATPITLAVDGVNSVGEWDIENNNLGDAGPLCLPGALNDKLDVATQTLDPRPTVTDPTMPAPNFIPGNNVN